MPFAETAQPSCRKWHPDWDFNLSRDRHISGVIWLAGRCADVFVNKGKTAESIIAVRESLKSMYGMDILAVHLKPAYREKVIQELNELGIEKLRVMEPGRIYEW